jgi:hypothetical protein
MTIRFTKWWMFLSRLISLSDFAPLLLGVFALSRRCIVQDRVEAQPHRSGTIKVKRFNRFSNIGAERLPCIPLGKNALTKRLGHKAAVSLLRDFKYQFVHLS